MTEQEWLEDPWRLLAGNVPLDERLLLLFGVACCRRHWNILDCDVCREAVETAEAFAEGHCDRQSLASIREKLERTHRDLCWAEEIHEARPARIAHRAVVDRPAALQFQAEHSYDGNMLAALKEELASFLAVEVSGSREEEYEKEMTTQAAILRDMFGPVPFRGITLDPACLAWRDGTVVKLAQRAYDERKLPSGELDNGQLAILADALEESGFTGSNADEILGHLRSKGPHYRGWWAVDLVLGC